MDNIIDDVTKGNENESVASTVGSMIPQVGLDGTASSDEKPLKGNIEDIIKKDSLEFTDDMKDFFKDGKAELTEESVEDYVLNYDADVKIGRKMRKALAIKASYMVKYKVFKANKAEKDILSDIKSKYLMWDAKVKHLLNDADEDQKKAIRKIEAGLAREINKDVKAQTKAVSPKKQMKELKKQKMYESVSVTPIEGLSKEIDYNMIHEESCNGYISDSMCNVLEAADEITKVKNDIKFSDTKYEETNERKYKLMKEGYSRKLSKLEKAFFEAVDAYFEAKKDMEAEIAPIVDMLEEKGYRVKYASPGHSKLCKKEDKEPDGVYKGKIYSDARIMFEEKYDFSGCPEGWHWREVDGCSYLDINEKTYDEKDGTPNEAFDKWKKSYMNSLKNWVSDLKYEDSEKSGNHTKELEISTESVYDYMADLMESM